MPYAELLEDDPSKVEIDTSFADRYLIRQLPGANYHPDTQRWHARLSWATCITLRGLFREELHVGPKMIDWAREQLETRIYPITQLRGVLSARDVSHPDVRDVLACVDEIETADGRHLFTYQRADVAYLALAGHGILANPPGLGKTGAAIRTAQVLDSQGKDPFPLLVICPNTIKRTWEDEFKVWAPDITVSVIDGPAGKRRKAIEADAQVYVVNWESLRIHSRLSRYGAMSLTDDEKTPKELNHKGFRTVIADEAHRAKDCHARQTRAMWALMHPAEYRFLLTGTPVVSNLGDLWALLHAIEPEGFPAKTKYIERWARVDLGFFGGAEILGINPVTAAEFRAVTEPLYRRIPKAAALPMLPPKLPVQYRYCEMTLLQSRMYAQMEKNLTAVIRDAAGQGQPVTAQNAVSQLTRLLQFASASAETYEDTAWDKTQSRDPVTGETIIDLTERKVTKVRLKAPSSKVDDLIALLDETDDEPLVVAAMSSQLIDLAAARLRKEEITHGLITGAQAPDERHDAIQAFQQGKLRVMLLTIDAGGEGITLTRASRILFMQRSFSLIRNEQVEARLHRYGQTSPVQVIDQIAPGTVEYRKLDILADKGEQIEEVLRDSAAILRLLGSMPASVQAAKIVNRKRRGKSEDNGEEGVDRSTEVKAPEELAAG